LLAIDLDIILEDDMQYILEIEKQSFFPPWSYQSFLYELTNDHSFVFGARNKTTNDPHPIIAYICFRILENEMHILKIAVENKWRRHGVASYLLESYLKDMAKRKVQAAFLEVRSSNIPAISFYDKHGFKHMGRRLNYYSNSKGTEDAILMMKELKEAT